MPRQKPTRAAPPKAAQPTSSCDQLKASTGSLLVALKKKYASHQQVAAWEAEGSYWSQILTALENEDGGIKFNYRIESVLGFGGAGVVFRVIDCNLYAELYSDEPPDPLERLRRSYRALKVPRPHIEKGLTLADALRDEVSRLIALEHPNIVGLYAKGQVPLELPTGSTSWPWYVMGYLHHATDLQELCERKPPDLPILIGYLYDIALGLKYVHANGVIHCDVKPPNIFLSRDSDVSSSGHAVLADFGYAKLLRSGRGQTTVGFTDYFAHPDLQFGALVSSQGSRSFKKVSRNSLRPAFDLFALGMTIDYLLERYYRRYATYRRYRYEINYLKLCAARLLDGLNHQKEISYGTLPDYCFRDQGTEGVHHFSPGIRYQGIDEFQEDLEKLLGMRSLESSLPELVPSRRENIQVSDSAPVIYTERLRRVVDHPLVRRLASTTQLGLVSLVYPGGTHSRLEHALGTFGVTARYISSLYHDDFTPLFRQLVTVEHMKATLLAALLHDVGQYPLAHDLEDVSPRFFSHENFGDLLLSTDRPSPAQAKLFPEFDGETTNLAKDLDLVLQSFWGVSLADVRRIFRSRSSDDKSGSQVGSHVERLCKSILDGPIDADKVDYLERDSRHCNVTYGLGIDRQRLFKCLTVASYSVKEDRLLLVVGVREKGRISAESILFARYAMLTQVYWHHTMRAIKALLHLAACAFLERVEEESFERIQEDFFRCAVLGEEVIDSEWKAILARSQAISSIHPSDVRVLGWLWQHTTDLGKVAVVSILSRELLLKRVLTVYRSELTEGQRRVLDKVYSPERYKERLALRETVERALLVRLQKEDCPGSLLETQ